MLIDTNVLIRLLTGDPPEQAERARRLIAASDELVLPDVIVAECVYVLESVYGLSRQACAELLNAVIASRQVRVGSAPLLQRALSAHAAGLGFPDAYLVALSEVSDGRPIVSFDRGLDSVAGVERIEP